MAKALVFAGSKREDSSNFKLATYASKKLEEKCLKVTLVNLNDYEMPLYCGDIEKNEGIPESVKKFQKLLLDHDAILIASPEYNSSVTPLLKNLIDWTSRPSDVAKGLEGYKGKLAAVISASPGALGGLRGLTHIREILSNIGVMVIPEQASIGSSYSAFNDEGNLENESDIKRIDGVIGSLADKALKLY